MKYLRFLLRLAAVLGALFTAPVALADTPSEADIEAAQQLVDEGYALEKKGDIDGAIARYERAGELVPEPKLAKRIEELSTKGARARAQSMIAEGYALERAGKLKEAAALYRQALKAVTDPRVAQRLKRIEGQLGTAPAAPPAEKPVPPPGDTPPAPAEKPEMKPEPAADPVPAAETPPAQETPPPAEKPAPAETPDTAPAPVPDTPPAVAEAGPGYWKQIKRSSDKAGNASHVKFKHDGYGHDSEFNKEDASAPTGAITGELSTHFEMEDYDALNELKPGAEIKVGIYQSRHYSSPDQSRARIVWVPAETPPGELPANALTVLKDVELPRPYSSKENYGTFKVPAGPLFPGGKAVLRVEGVFHGEVTATSLLYEWVPEKP